ncbi:hypothetical protein O6H91_23G053100 [Diphasiastrum complanatum]|uniref:Uncharacterized protein n=1 Tax=Diphasiastrum complanatum TaxID=34168 RepID=A0ACC2AAP9_DIPCM|nr:hypothetical protein O6H91_23G053100 [Diphasiastrum complanatum]
MSNFSVHNPGAKDAKIGSASLAIKNSMHCIGPSSEHEATKTSKDSDGIVRAKASISDTSQKASISDSADGLGCLFSAPSIAGILYKWVNLGKGWRPRWFVLHDGVLSYYKVHGPHKISLNHEVQRGLKLIGEEAQRLMRKHKNFVGEDKRSLWIAFGEVHLKVASLRESKSDDKKFYIYTGTKTLHLRAESKEDRTAWLDALRSSKELFPNNSSIGSLVPSEDITVSTEKLSARLREEGVSKETIRECEEIVLMEFSRLQQQLNILQQKRLSLIDKLRLLEADKVELETTVMDEMRNRPEVEKDLGASDIDSEDENVKPSCLEGETDDEDDVFFDTEESLVVESFRSPSFIARQRSFDLAIDSQGDKSLCLGSKKTDLVPMDQVGYNYPIVRRRKKLPDPKEKEKSVSLWSIIKDNIGKDLSKVCLPVYFNEPISSLQRCFEDLEYSYLLDQAFEWGKRGNSLMRILSVAAFAVSGYSSTEGRTCKPFNPLLGETYEADYPEKGVRFISEKVSHHPMILACHCEGRGWRFWGDSNLKSKFWGRSIELDPVGVLTLEFEDGEVFQWSKVTTSINNLILGKLYVDHYGTMRIQGNRELFCRMKFKEQSIIDRNPHQVQGYVSDKSGQKLATLAGKWDENLYFVMGDATSKQKGNNFMDVAVLLWQRNEPPQHPTRYNLTSFAMTLNEITPGLKEKLPPTDSRLRPDQRHLENGEYDLANAEKLRLEQKQRQARKLQEKGWVPRWFNKSMESDSFLYAGGYWEARGSGHWENCPDIFGSTLSDASVD